ncbi:hypothetical protein GALMADRAFT_220086 [Galerina marginata CBS 339.88]|uniref:Uncharacterized protein n=1 Tax=Galerina marginata (strain CBS 339.88) TaxID=685588 RepID=A0A067TWF2_GALM3|nr:hypothetical protein GALMADRAFT_220086 [Galerina marginata CBS 339.88]
MSSPPPSPPTRSRFGRMRGIMRRASSSLAKLRRPRRPSEQDSDSSSLKSTPSREVIEGPAMLSLPPKAMELMLPSPVAESPAREAEATQQETVGVSAPAPHGTQSIEKAELIQLAPPSVEHGNEGKPEQTVGPIRYIPPAVIDSSAGNPGAFTDYVETLPQPNVIVDPHAEPGHAEPLTPTESEDSHVQPFQEGHRELFQQEPTDLEHGEVPNFVAPGHVRDTETTQQETEALPATTRQSNEDTPSQSIEEPKLVSPTTPAALQLKGRADDKIPNPMNDAPSPISPSAAIPGAFKDFMDELPKSNTVVDSYTSPSPARARAATDEPKPLEAPLVEPATLSLDQPAVDSLEDFELIEREELITTPELKDMAGEDASTDQHAATPASSSAPNPALAPAPAAATAEPEPKPEHTPVFRAVITPPPPNDRPASSSYWQWGGQSTTADVPSDPLAPWREKNPWNEPAPANANANGHATAAHDVWATGTDVHVPAPTQRGDEAAAAGAAYSGATAMMVSPLITPAPVPNPVGDKSGNGNSNGDMSLRRRTTGSRYLSLHRMHRPAASAGLQNPVPHRRPFDDHAIWAMFGVVGALAAVVMTSMLLGRPVH